MNREIKFRAWDKQKRRLIEHSMLFRLDTTNEIPFLPLLEKFIPEYEVMQYTGLKDKNGNEIYEGDLVSDLLNGSLGEVTFDEGCYLVDWEDELTTITLHQNIREFDVVVVGNIYENPELLERDEE